MPNKNPMLVERIVINSGTGSSGIYLADGTTIVDDSGNIDAPVTTTNLTTTGNTTLGDSTSDTLTVSGKINLAQYGSAAASASGLLMGVGTTAAPATTSTADAKFIEVRAQTTATSGDNRLAYLRYDIAGTTGGECVRAFTKVTAATTTVRGAHISLDMGDTDGTVSGLGAGVDAQLLMGNTAYSAGTWGVVNAEIFSDGTSTDISGATFSFFRLVAGGNATGAANVDANVFLFDCSSGLTTASGRFIDTDITTHTAYGGIPIKTDDGTKWIAVVSA